MSHFGEELWEYAFGGLSSDERKAMDAHRAECAACAAKVREAEETLAMVALDLPPETPSPSLRERLLDETRERLQSETRGRYEGVLDKIAELWDLGRERARELVDSMATAVWSPSGIPGVELLHVTGGPRVAGADAGFVRFQPGKQFPLHDHLGDEVQLILEGGMTDDRGIEFHVGDRMVRAQGSSHSFVAGREGCIIALLLVGGIVIDGKRYGTNSD